MAKYGKKKNRPLKSPPTSSSKACVPLPSSAMTRAVIALLLVALLQLAAAHELCIDSLDPSNVQMTFCPEYSGHSCCSPERDAQIAAQYNAITPQPPEECLVFLRHMFCAEWYLCLFFYKFNVKK